MKSEAKQSSASITLELNVGSDLDDALVRVTNLLAQVPNYPDNARQPVVSTGDSTGPPLAVIIVQSDPPGRQVAEYRTWLEDNIISQFERIPGVASIRVVGGREQEVHVDFDVDKLAAKGITLSQVAATIRSELVDVSGGDISLGKRRYVVRTALAPVEPSELEAAVIRTDEAGSPITLGHVAKVHFGLRKREAVGIINGSPIKEVQGAIRGALSNIPDVFGFASQASLFGRRLGGGRSIEVDIRGSNLPEMLNVGGALFGALKKALPGGPIRPIPGLDPGAPELRVTPKRALAAAQGFSSSDLGLLVDAYVDGAIIGELGRAGEPKRDLVLRAMGDQSMSPAVLEASPIATPRGRLAPSPTLPR